MSLHTVPPSAGGPAQVPQPQDRPAAVAPDSAVHGDPVHILIVDDEPRNLTVLETILDDPRYRLVRAESADQALHALVSQEFALLILDIRMPGMSGFELAQMIKERKKTSQVPIIFLTAYYNEDQHALEGYSSGAVDYLHKPVNPVILRSKVAVFAELHWRSRECVMANHALLAEVIERRRAEEALASLTGKLMQAQEQERRGIAYDLQDNFNQRLAALSVEIGVIENTPTCLPEAVARRLAPARVQVNQLSDDLHDLACKLHPSLLDHVGLVTAVRDHVAGFTKQTGLSVTVTARKVRKALPPEVATALFRMMQESLQNVSKHAAATYVTFRLFGSSKGIGFSCAITARGSRWMAIRRSEQGSG